MAPTDKPHSPLCHGLCQTILHRRIIFSILLKGTESSSHRDVPNIHTCCVNHHNKVHPERSERTLNPRTKSSWHLQNRKVLPRTTSLRRTVRIVASMCFKVMFCIKINTNLFKSQGLSTWASQLAQELGLPSPSKGRHAPARSPRAPAAQGPGWEPAHSNPPWNKWEPSPHSPLLDPPNVLSLGHGAR